VELITPLTGDGRLDREGLTRLVARLEPVAAGLLAGSPGAGEALALPLATRRDLLTHLLDTLAGRLPLVFTVTGHSWEETREWAKALTDKCRARRYPGPVFLADLPLWWHSNRGLPQTYQGLLAEFPLPWLVLNFPEVVARRAAVFKHRNLRTQVVKKLTTFPGVVGLIYRGEMRRFLNYHHAAAARPGWAFYEADETRFLTRPGAWGVLSPGAQLLPAAWGKVTRACLHPEEVAQDHQGRLELWELSRRLLELAQLGRTHPAALVKAALASQGVIATAATAPGTPPPAPKQREHFLALLASLAP
jgi:dihydrodipicolinate synthase/N-acetylneuraminate lyase